MIFTAPEASSLFRLLDLTLERRLGSISHSGKPPFQYLICGNLLRSPNLPVAGSILTVLDNHLSN